MIDFSRNHFALFDLPQQFSIDDAALARAWHELQRAVHPDRFAGAGDAERRAALQASARVNDAYATLRDPVARAEYLLALRGVSSAPETDTHLPVAFLTLQMERREAAEEASGAGDMPALTRLIDAVEADAAGLQSVVARLLDVDDAEARARVREWRFLVKLGADLHALAMTDVDR